MAERSEREQMLDRQLRLLGMHGQKNLDNAHVCVLGAGPAASETLKNLVLPNVGAFTLIDGQKVTVRDLGNNFFVDRDSLGKSRAEVVTQLLCEMNGVCKGTAVAANPEDLIQKNIDGFAKFTLVIATELPEGPRRKLASFCFDHCIPFMNITTNGLMASLRTAIPEHFVFESHPDGDLSDLFLHPKQLETFPELKKFLFSFDFNAASDYDHAHTPYAAVLVQQLAEWSKKNNGKIPQSFEEKNDFKKQILAAQRQQLTPEDNFFEAKQFAHYVFVNPEPPQDITDCLNDAKADNITKASHSFWILIRAVKEFMKKEGQGFLPVYEDIPDMASSTKSYLALKEVYKNRSQADLKAIVAHTQALLKQIGREPESIPVADIAHFVKNIRAVKFVRFRSLEQEYTSPKTDELNEFFEDMEVDHHAEANAEEKPFFPKDIYWYFALRAADEFYNQKGRYPGAGDKADLKSDVAELKDIQKKQFEAAGIKAEIVEQCLVEITRYAGTQLHTIGAFIGGVAAQEAMKIICQQYVPVDNTYIYNGIQSSGIFFDF